MNIYNIKNRAPMVNKICAVLIAMTLPAIMFCQVSAVNVTVNVLPPYSPYISDWESHPERIVVTLQPTGTTASLSVRLSGLVEGFDSDILITTKESFRPVRPIMLLPGVPYTVTAAEIGELFNVDALNFSGISDSQIRAGSGLPEGTYRVCVRALDYTTGTPLSDSEPSGCSAPFTIRYVETPTIISPVCDATVPAVEPQSVIFRWLQPAGAPASTQYTLKIVEVIPEGRNPNDAMASATTPAFFEQTVLAGQYMYGPGDPPLLPGRTYAWRITANDPMRSVIFRNEGRSEVCGFRYGTLVSDALQLGGVYPSNNSFVPFVPPHIIVRFSPYADDITEMDYTLRIWRLSSRDSAPVGSPTHTNSRRLRWPFGPRAGQGVDNNERASHIIVNITGPEGPADWSSSLEQGVWYAWSVESRFIKAGSTVTVTSPVQKFSIGVQPANLIEPPNGHTFTRSETIQLEWQSSAPSPLNPPDLLGIRRTAPGVFFGISTERQRLEISTDPVMSTIIDSLTQEYPMPECYTGDECADLFRRYTQTLPTLPDGRYYWRASWLKPDSSPYSQSPIWSFNIGEETPPDTTDRERRRDDIAGSCADDCSADPISNTTPSTRSYSVGDVLELGRFELNLTRVSGTGNSLSGEGSVQVPFLRRRILVEFSNIRVNTDNRVFEGTVNAKQATGSPIPQSLANQLGSALGLNQNQIDLLTTFSSEATRLVTYGLGETPIDLPIGFDRVIEGERYVLAVIGMVFRPIDARLNAAMAFPVPPLGPGVGVGLGAREICFHRNGLGGDGSGQLYLAADHGYREPDTWGFVFKAPTESDSGTYVSWDCEGFKELRLSAEVEFPREWFTPNRDDGGLVKARFKTTVRRGGDWIASASMDRSFITGLPGFVMEVQEMTIDQSDVRNPEGIVFPRGYIGEQNERWQGFFINRATITLPEELKTFEGDRRVTLSVNNFILGRSGLTASFRAENVIHYPLGNFGEWGASIDTIAIDFVSGSLQSGSMKGRFQIPITDSSLVYSATLSRPDPTGSGLRYEFVLQPKDTINANIWEAKLSLNPTSRIEITNRSGEFDAAARLSGALTLQGNVGGIPQLNFRGVRFEGFRVSTLAPHIERGTWSFASEQRSVAGFPISIDNINVVTGSRGGRPGAGVQFTISVNLQPGNDAISGGTTLSVWGKMVSSPGEGQRFEFDSIDLDSIGIRAELGAVNIEGGIRLYREDATFGNGFRGNVHAVFLQQVNVRATIQFGTVRGFRYWYVDAMAAFSTGIPIFTGVGFYGFGGGAWYNMRREGSDPAIATASTRTDSSSEPGRTNSGYRFIPDSDYGLGFRAMVILGTHPTPDAFNGDVYLEIAFLSGGGVGRISIGGRGYMLAGITDRSSARVTASVDVTYDFPASTFHGVFEVNVNASPLTGGGRMVMHFDPVLWYIKIGEPEPANRVNLTLADWLRIDAYLMVGMNLPPPPDLPVEVSSILGPMPVTRDPEITSGDGFAFGASAHFGTPRLTFLIFYGYIRAGIGFDIALLNFGPSVSCEGVSGAIGVNGWYAMGQLYAYINASIGMYVDLWFVQEEIEILGISVAAALQGGAPNPTWIAGRVGGHFRILGGVIEGYCNFEFKMGDECRPVRESPLARLDLVSDISPTDGARNIDVFVEPQAAFNFKIDEPFEIRELTGDGSDRIRTFRVKVGDFTLEQSDPRQRVTGRWSLSRERVQATLSPQDMLAGYTRYTARVDAYGEEYQSSGSWQPARKRDGSTIVQSVSTTFTTAGAPDHIPFHNIAYTYPLDRQRYFLQNECRDGRVVLKMGQHGLFAPRDGYQVTFIARFIPTFGGDPLEVPARYINTAREVEFALPRLQNSAVYAVQIVRKEERIRTIAETIDTEATSAAGTRAVTAVTTLRTAMRHGDAFVDLREQRLPGTQVRSGERLLYHYYFRNSRYNTLRDKITALSAEPTEAPPPLGNFELLTAQFSGPELFDRYDLGGHSYTRDGRGQRLKPLVSVSANARNDRWHQRFSNPWIYDVVDRMRRIGLWTGRTNFETHMLTPTRSLAEYKIPGDALLYDWEIGPRTQSSSGSVGSIGGVSAYSSTFGIGTIGYTPVTPTVRIEYKHGIIVPMDFADVQRRASWALSTYGGEFLSTDLQNLLRNAIAKRYERLYSGQNYTLWFSYTFCVDPDRPVTFQKTFRY
jgi:TANFOR domain-containing protein